MGFFLQIAVNGVAAGAIYGLIAVGYSLTFTTTKTLNFALGMWVMLGTMLTYSLCVQVGLLPLVALPLVVGALFALGVCAERVSIYPFIQAKSELWVMSTLAVGLLLIDVAEMVWGRGQNRVPPYLGEAPLYVGDVSVRPQQLLSVVAVVSVYLGLELFYRRTLTGKAFRAVAHDRATSSLMAIDVRRVEVLSYAASTALAGLAGFLIVPLTGADPHMGTGLGFRAFAVAIIGGLAAPRGILFFGLFYGGIEAVVAGYVDPGLKDIIGFALMILALSVWPQGVLGGRYEDRV